MKGGTNMEEIIKKLTELSKTIATMESCTGGAVANSITNIEGASLVFKFGAVTYSNEYKIKMGVDSNIIDKYTVYSIETAMEMSKNIAEFSNADYGIGITGKINREDQNNMFGDNSKIFISIFESGKNNFSNFEIVADSNLDREGNKKIVINKIIEKMKELLKLNQ
jgi:competence/damage-inducible protein cinA C-terminal domain